MRRDRIGSARLRLSASYHLATGVVAPEERELWNKKSSGTIKEVTLSADQQQAMDYWTRHLDVSSADAT